MAERFYPHEKFIYYFIHVFYTLTWDTLNWRILNLSYTVLPWLLWCVQHF